MSFFIWIHYNESQYITILIQSKRHLPHPVGDVLFSISDPEDKNCWTILPVKVNIDLGEFLLEFVYSDAIIPITEASFLF